MKHLTEGIVLIPAPGTSIAEAAKEACAFVSERDASAHLLFNDLVIDVRLDAVWPEIVTAYWRAVEKAEGGTL